MALQWEESISYWNKGNAHFPSRYAEQLKVYEKNLSSEAEEIYAPNFYSLKKYQFNEENDRERGIHAFNRNGEHIYPLEHQQSPPENSECQCQLFRCCSVSTCMVLRSVNVNFHTGNENWFLATVQANKSQLHF